MNLKDGVIGIASAIALSVTSNVGAVEEIEIILKKRL